MSERNLTASDIAKWFLAHNRCVMIEGDSDYISNLKLQKLLYYAQGCFLGLRDKKLFDDPIEAWTHGPVVPSVYQQYKSNGSSGIEFDEDYDFAVIPEDTQNILKEVYDIFGQYSAWKLRNMTHEEQPWIDTPQSCEISTDLISDYFKREYIER